MGNTSTNRPRRSLVIFGLLWVPWAAVVLRFWWTGEGTALEDVYFTVRDTLQPHGYAISGSLRSAPSWALAHLVAIGLPWVVFLAGRWLVGRIRGARPGHSAEVARK